MKTQSFLMVIALVTLSACEREFTGASPNPIVTEKAVGLGANRPRCMGRHDSVMCLDARIFDPHTAVVPNPMPEKNLVVTDSTRLPKFRRGRHTAGTLSQPGNGDAGWFVNSYYQRWGRGIFNAVYFDFDIPSNIADSAPPDTGVQIFAPTHKPRDGCIEATVMYRRYPNDVATRREMGWYDFCAATPQWVTIEDMDAQSWQNNYIVRPGWDPTGDGAAEIAIGIESVPGTDCWQGIMFNVVSNNYDQKAYSCGTPSNAGGWSFWESYYLVTHLSDATQCPTLPRANANVLVYTDTVTWQWHPLIHANITQFWYGQPCWTSGYYALNWDWLSDTSSIWWRALTP